MEVSHQMNGEVKFKDIEIGPRERCIDFLQEEERHL